MQYKQFFRFHSFAIILALCASLLAAFPQAYFRIDHREAYQEVDLLPNSPWLGRVREIQDGHGFGSIYYDDGKEDPYLFQPLGSMTVAYMGTVLGLDIKNTFLAASLILPFITFLAVYSFIYLISRARLAALAGAALILAAQPVLSIPTFSRFLLGIIPTDIWELSQAANPAMIYILFFGFLAAFYVAHRRGDWRWGALSAVLLGLNFYNYFYTATFLYAFGGILGLAFLIRRKWSDAKLTAAVFMGGLVVAIPYFWNLYQATQHPNYEALSARFAVIHSHEPVFVGITVAVALIAFLLWYPRDRSDYLYSLSLMLAPVLTLNQQILTGKMLQAGHYHWYFNRPVAVIFALLTLYFAVSRYAPRYGKQVLAAGVILVSFAAASIVQLHAYRHDSHIGEPIALAAQKYGPVLGWLNEHAEPDEVTFTSMPLAKLVVIYTPLNVYYHHAALHALSATEERLRDQLYTYYRLKGVGRKDAPEAFERDRAEISTGLYGLYYRDLYGDIAKIPQEKLDAFTLRYQESLATPIGAWLKEQFSKYRVRYVVWDRAADPGWRLDAHPFLKEAAVFGDLVIYRVTP